MIDCDRQKLKSAIAGVLGWHIDDSNLPAQVREDHNTVIQAARLVADPDTLIISKVDAEHWHRSAVAILEPFMRDEHLADRLVRASYALDALLEGLK